MKKNVFWSIDVVLLVVMIATQVLAADRKKAQTDIHKSEEQKISEQVDIQVDIYNALLNSFEKYNSDISKFLSIQKDGNAQDIEYNIERSYNKFQNIPITDNFLLKIGETKESYDSSIQYVMERLPLVKMQQDYIEDLNRLKLVISNPLINDLEKVNSIRGLQTKQNELSKTMKDNKEAQILFQNHIDELTLEENKIVAIIKVKGEAAFKSFYRK